MSDEHLEPAKSVIAKIGIKQVSEVTGTHITRVYRWMYTKERGGTNGVIPNAAARALLAYAAEKGIDLSAADFFPSAPTPAPVQHGEAAA